MNKTIIFVGFIICALVGTILSKTKFEFPAEQCAGVILGDYVGCIGALAISIWKIHQWGEDTPLSICGNQCTGNLKGRFRKWKWVWDAKFHCQDLAEGIQGEGTASGRDSTMQQAIKDWITKASEAGRINADDFQC